MDAVPGTHLPWEEADILLSAGQAWWGKKRWNWLAHAAAVSPALQTRSLSTEPMGKLVSLPWPFRIPYSHRLILPTLGTNDCLQSIHMHITTPTLHPLAKGIGYFSLVLPESGNWSTGEPFLAGRRYMSSLQLLLLWPMAKVRQVSSLPGCFFPGWLGMQHPQGSCSQCRGQRKHSLQFCTPQTTNSLNGVLYQARTGKENTLLRARPFSSFIWHMSV